MTEDDMRTLLKHERALDGGTWVALAEKWEVSAAYVHACATGEKPVTDAMARRMGYRKVTTVSFEPVREAVE